MGWVLDVVVVVVTTGKQSQLPGLAWDGSLTKNDIFREKRKAKNNPNIIVVRRSNQVGQAIHFPKY